MSVNSYQDFWVAIKRPAPDCACVRMKPQALSRWLTSTAFAVTAFLVGAISLIIAAPANADVAVTMQTELLAAGVPGTSVTVTTPPAATAADLAAWDANPSAEAPSVSPENLISPNPTQPLPVATVRFDATPTTPLAGLIAPPGGMVPSVEDAESAVSRLEIMMALRRGLADGASLAGVAMQPIDQTRPDMWLTPPDPAYIAPVRLVGVTPVPVVSTAVEEGLPAWAQGASTTVTESSGERRVTLGLRVDPRQLIVQNFEDLAPYLLGKQVELNEEGAGIGGVILEIDDPNGSPLFIYAGDATFGQSFFWTSPLVAAWVDSPPAGSAQNVLNQVKD